MNLKILVMVINTNKTVEEDSAKLRGYIGNKFPEHPLLHHHIEGKGYIYTYPKIQYKIIEGVPIIVGVEEGVKILKEISDDIEELKLGKKKYKIKDIQMHQLYTDFGKCRQNIKYKFLTPWLALSQEKYKKYKEIKDWKERKTFLNSILAGNVISMCKGLDYIVRGKIYAHSLLEKVTANYKAIPHMAFVGEFKINFKIPDFMGLGKGVSHGFGTIKRVENDREKT